MGPKDGGDKLRANLRDADTRELKKIVRQLEKPLLLTEPLRARRGPKGTAGSASRKLRPSKLDVQLQALAELIRSTAVMMLEGDAETRELDRLLARRKKANGRSRH